MKNCETISLKLDELQPAAQQLLANGGRMQGVYAWYSASGRARLRYVATRPGYETCLGWSVDVGDDPVPSLAAVCPLLGWQEREIMEMSGIAFFGHPEPERLVTACLPDAPTGPLVPADACTGELVAALSAPSLPAVSGKHVQLLPFGPVRADVLESAQFVFYYVGEGILYYHPNLFLKHRGMEKQFEGMECGAATLLAERVSGVDSFAQALAYVQAVEDAAQCSVPKRAEWFRVIAAELERIYNHLHYLGHLCHTTTLKVGESQGKLLEELAKQINARACGSRFLRNLLWPGGVRRELDIYAVAKGLSCLKPQIEAYIGLIERTTSHLDRLISTAPLSQKLAFDQGATGPVERASGVDRDLRRDHPYAMYRTLAPAVALEAGGDACARMRVRIAELRASIDLVERAIDGVAPGGPILAACPVPAAGEGLGWAESSRGTVMYAVHFDDAGRLARVKIKSPSFANWRVFQSTVYDSNMMDYAINEASFGLTIAGCAR
ncbi:MULTISPECIES: NADH-quinone oxidoreductase subunit C [Burkholderia cepacia complex]|uniref:NADH-quinone oxidoreductase subunit C n=1 Tax=Burkholderia vietnamiensis TaxID=60552 RepID=A0AAW7T4I0_BURVI|nr:MULTISPECIES: NADH-quinone oxidoreductase subunit C [Burkholderia cepacia complex]MBR8373004.1 NADH-quinone oxidoreductase subunit C [Burkholderia cenocepacia]MBR8441929.1 NADH-quinone oxidoreductase subunit C [Burkholderia cenocepacia]MBU9142441.1 NADH-quinone oxidoreductase subunit C [Burkholderia multivorans]MBU9205534.1 NADH-quinone oxidoreductase subunit C [Burkholderia multivorans]MBU9303730.1 NADH-quinone oxidoreductase subunit C [Burkholderia multivorans]